MSRKDPIIQRLLIPILLITCTLIVHCTHEHPPFDEYQIVGFTPIDTVTTGKLIRYGSTLYALYDPSYTYTWARLRTYDVSNPYTPALVSSSDIDNLDPYDYATNADTFVFFINHPSLYIQNICVFNLNTQQLVSIETDFNINSLACKGNRIFISGSDGLKIWDISALPNYTEVTIDTFSRWYGRLALLDTIMLEVYNTWYGNAFAFWNITNPEQPQLIVQGDFLLQPYFIEMTHEFVFAFSSGLIYRYSYDFSDSLTMEDIYTFDYYYDGYKVCDILMYLLRYEQIKIIKADDFSVEWAIRRYRDDIAFLCLELYEDKIYTLTRNKGIIVYERREP
jgi:hypothetical protein